MVTSGFTRRVILWGGALSLAPRPARAALAWNHRVTSPNKRLVAELAPGPTWNVLYRGKVILTPSHLGLVLENGDILGPGATPLGITRRSLTDGWSPRYGAAAHYAFKGEEITAEFLDRRRALRFAVILRVYDAGVAVRYVLRKTPDGTPVRVSGEKTCFALGNGAQVYASRDEGEYYRSSPKELAPVSDPETTASSDKGRFADLPVTVTFPDGIAALIAESDRLHYPRAMLRPDVTSGFVTHLMHYPGRATGYSGPGDTPPEPVFELREGQATPWRILLVAKSDKDLISTSALIPTLASPCVLSDASWIKPGRAIRVRVPYTTERALRVVDFAQQHKLEYIEFDAHWYGDGTDASDATKPISGLDLQKVIDSAKARGVGTILYVDRVPAMTQLDGIVTTYQAWGVAGVKFGFVWEGRQSDNDLIYGIVKTCGEHKLLVNLHDDLRPAGLERTLPNYIALEGVRGNEHFPTARHNVTLPFTRNIAGPIDYTICYANPKNQTTNAHQLAMAAVYYNPLTFLYWYDEPDKYAGASWPELKWFDECPTTWAETRVLSGRIGEHVAIARRNGSRWFLGIMTNEQGRRLALPLSFLGVGRWKATIYADGDETAPAWKTLVTISEKIVTRSDTLDVQLNPSGGQAVLFEPVGA